MSDPWLAIVAICVLGAAVLVAVELRLKAMRDLFNMALMQRESFEATARDLAARIDTVSERVNVVVATADNDRQENDRRFKRIEGVLRLDPFR